MRKEDRKPSKRVFPLLQNLDLDSVTFEQVQGVGDSITIEDMNEQELQDLVLVNLARLVVSGEWTGLLEAGGGGGGIASVAFSMRNASPNTTYDYYPMNVTQSGTLAIADVLGGNQPKFYPFTVGEAGDIADLSIYVASASSSNTCLVGVYTSENGMPKTKISGLSFDVSSTGSKTGALDATTTLEVGVQYWVGVTKGNTGDTFTTYSSDSTKTVNNFPSSDPFSRACIYSLASSDNTLPSTVTTANMSTIQYNTMLISLRF